MRSTSPASPAHRAKPASLTRLTLSLALLAAAACDVGNDQPPTDPDRQPTPPSSMKDVSEVSGTVQAWPGEAEASCGARLMVTRFRDDVGARAATETRVLLTTPEAYRSYFGHPAPAGVQLGKEWVVFYSAGRQGAGSIPDVGVVGVRGDVLHVVTTLTAPTPPCVPPPGGPAPMPVPDPAPMPAPMTAPGSGPTTTPPNTGSGGAPTPPSTGAAPPPNTVAPPPVSVPPSLPRPGLNYVLVKFPAQATRSVEFQHQDIRPTCPVQPNPCAAVLCAPGQMCVVLESYPPRAQCVPQPAPDRCVSSDSCPAGTRCSTERGDCQSCGRDPATACPAVCFGVCEPSSGQTCSGGLLMGGCRSAEELKLEADKLCRSQNQVLTDFGTGAACFAGGFVEAKYTCCGGDLPVPMPPVPTPSGPTCEWQYLGGDGSCKSYDAWKMEASAVCGHRQLGQIATGGRCTGDAYVEVKFECCGVKR